MNTSNIHTNILNSKLDLKDVIKTLISICTVSKKIEISINKDRGSIIIYNKSNKFCLSNAFKLSNSRICVGNNFIDSNFKIEHINI